MTAGRIGVIGAAGDIGRRVVRSLIMLGVPTADLLVAGRRPEVLPEVLGSASSTGRRVDVNDPRGLTAFAGDVDLVIDATGPSHERALTTARLVGRAGAHLVSVGGPADARTVSSLEPPGDRRVLMYAGALPGVSGIVARAALLDDPGTATLEVCAGAVEPSRWRVRRTTWRGWTMATSAPWRGGGPGGPSSAGSSVVRRSPSRSSPRPSPCSPSSTRRASRSPRATGFAKRRGTARWWATR